MTLPVLAVIWRPLVLESLDPGFMAAAGGRGGRWHLGFLALVVLCVVAGFAALGTLMSVGLMMLPAIAARHWSAHWRARSARRWRWRSRPRCVGLLLSFNVELPAGPAIVLTAGALWLASLLVGPPCQPAPPPAPPALCRLTEVSGIDRIRRRRSAMKACHPHRGSIEASK